MLSQHASIEGNRLCVGAQRYRAVIISPCLSLDARVAALLAQFAQNGGTILCAEAEEPKLRPQSASPTCRTAFPAQICGGLPEAFSAFHYTKLHKRFLPAAALFL